MFPVYKVKLHPTLPIINEAIHNDTLSDFRVIVRFC